MPETSTWVSTYLPLASTVVSTVATFVVAVATIVLVWLTSRYVRLTGHIVEETRRARAPSVTVDFEMPDQSLRLVVANCGQSPAKNVRFAVLKDVAWLQWLHTPDKSTGLAEVAPIKNGIFYITPSRTLKYHLGYPRWEGTEPEDMSVSIRITYDDDSGKPHEQTVDFDFGQMREILEESFKDPNLAVADAIRDTARNRRSHGAGDHFMKQMLEGPKKECPMCAEKVPIKARKCSHCHEILNGPNERVRSGPPT